MAMDTIRRLAADILGIGQNKVRISQEGVKEAEKAMTRSDVRELIKKGVITKIRPLGRRKKERRSRRGEGSRRGTAKTRQGDKEVWMTKVRSQRAFLRQLLADGALPKENKRVIYMRIKSGLFRSKRAFLAYLKENGITKQDYEPKKAVWVKKAKRVLPGTKPRPAQQKPAAAGAQKPAPPKPAAQQKAQSQRPVAKEGVKQ
jgi:large subunit ribosomal protein L19e